MICNYKNKAFTFAEVMITMSIIGIVAVLTMPQIVKHYKIQALQTGFQKTTSTIQQAVNYAMHQSGREDLSNITENEFNNEILPYITKHLNISGQQNITKRNTMYSSAKDYIMNYTNTTHGNSCFNPDSPQASITGYMLINGAFVCFRNLDGWNNINMAVDFDTNGFKGPNRYGYDIFEMKLGKGAVPYKRLRENGIHYCSENGSYAQHQSNGRHCAYYAIINQNPDDSSKTYWKSLK